MISKSFLTRLSQEILVISFSLWSFCLVPPSAHGQIPLYWDSGPSGNWNSIAWSPNSAGGSLTSWISTDNAVFSATNLQATGNYTVTLDADVGVGDLTYRGGDPGSTLQIAAVGGSAFFTGVQMNVTVDPLTTLVRGSRHHRQY